MYQEHEITVVDTNAERLQALAAVVLTRAYWRS
jgi:hypothetical protein